MRNVRLLFSRAFASSGVVAFLFALLLLPTQCFAQSTDLTTMLTTLTTQFPDLQKLFSAAAYVFGMGFILIGVYGLRIYGESRTMMPSHSNLAKPVSAFVGGALLIYLPTAYNMMLITVFGTNQITPLDYTSSQPQYQLLQKAVVGVINLVGLAAMMKGAVILARGPQQTQGGGSSMGKAFTHLVGGALALNIVAVKNILWTSLGLQ
jgi:intracellular multiplication protein IcmC